MGESHLKRARGCSDTKKICIMKDSEKKLKSLVLNIMKVWEMKNRSG